MELHPIPDYTGDSREGSANLSHKGQIVHTCRNSAVHCKTKEGKRSMAVSNKNLFTKISGRLNLTLELYPYLGPAKQKNSL